MDVTPKNQTHFNKLKWADLPGLKALLDKLKSDAAKR